MLSSPVESMLFLWNDNPHESNMLGDGLFLLIEDCPRLEQLGLSSCHGVNVVDRRRFFEVNYDFIMLTHLPHA
jgi:hypothetical protein